LFETVEKNLTAGGVLISIGVGRVWSFGHALIVGGALLFMVALLLLWVELFAPSTGGEGG
jgi:hypothetical protein